MPLRQEGDKPPLIRLAHPATLSKFKTRKRRRETAGSCLWVIGDRVDAWVNNRYMLNLVLFFSVQLSSNVGHSLFHYFEMEMYKVLKVDDYVAPRRA